MSERSIRTYAEFWPFYVQEHSNQTNRLLHFTGTSLAMVLLIGALVTQTWWLLVAVPVAGYGLAWVGHFGVEKNKPASFKYPFWSFISDFRMWALMLTGRMSEEVERAKASAVR